MRIFTIGYEGVTQAEFLGALEGAGVERIIDVRALPLSRRPGFSKTPLRTALAEFGIDYVHLKALGTPPEGREAARKGRHAELERIYAGQLELPEAIVLNLRRGALGSHMRQFMQRYDLLVTPSVAVPAFDARPAGHSPLTPDRKSTRLNSSHG